MAQRGIKGMVTLTGVRMLDEWVHLFQEEAAKAGRELALGEDLCWGVGMCIADTEEEAIQRMEPYHDERYKWFAPFGIVRYIDDQGRQWGTARSSVGRPFAARRRRPARLALRARVGDRRAHPRDRGALPGARPDDDPLPRGHGRRAEFMDQLRLFARDVMPAFQQAAVSAGEG